MYFKSKKYFTQILEIWGIFMNNFELLHWKSIENKYILYSYFSFVTFPPLPAYPQWPPLLTLQSAGLPTWLVFCGVFPRDLRASPRSPSSRPWLLCRSRRAFGKQTGDVLLTHSRTDGRFQPFFSELQSPPESLAPRQSASGTHASPWQRCC